MENVGEEVSILQAVFEHDLEICSIGSFIICKISGTNVVVGIKFHKDDPRVSPRCSIESSAFRNKDVEYLNDRLEKYSAEKLLSASWSSIDIVQTAFQLVDEITSSSGDIQDSFSTLTQTVSLSISRVLIYSHHIRSEMKKKEIREQANFFDLGGIWKDGFPGIIVVEGESNNVIEYTKIIQRLKWQHIVVRGEETDELPLDGTIDQYRKLPQPLQYCSTMSELGELANKHGIHELFMSMRKCFL